MTPAQQETILKQYSKRKKYEMGEVQYQYQAALPVI